MGVYIRDGSEKSKFQIKSLIHSRTVVEKDGYVSTGLLGHIEGEMMDIEMTEYKSFELGDPVSITVYSPMGIHRMQSTVVARAEGSIAVIFTPRALAGLEEKRESPRVEVTLGATFHRKLSELLELEDGDELVEAIEKVELRVVNVSLTGIGFKAMESYGIAKHDVIDVTLKIGIDLHCKLEIVRKEHGEGMPFYGGRFVELDELQQRALRAFLLREQIGVYYRGKQRRQSQHA